MFIYRCLESASAKSRDLREHTNDEAVDWSEVRRDVDAYLTPNDMRLTWFLIEKEVQNNAVGIGMHINMHL